MQKRKIVELESVRQLFNNPQQAYTQSLLSARLGPKAVLEQNCLKIPVKIKKIPKSV